LNVTRADMAKEGYSPSVRLFEAAACGAPVVSDRWAGLNDFFDLGRDIMLADDADDVLRVLAERDDAGCPALAQAARARVLAEHTAAHRAAQLERDLKDALAMARSKHSPEVARAGC